MRLSLEIDGIKWQSAVDTANESALAEFNKQPEARGNFVPVTIEEYAQDRLTELGESYERSRILALAKDPTIEAQFHKFLAQPLEYRAAVGAQIDALP